MDTHALLLCFAVFAVAAAVSRTEMFRWLRNIGRWAYGANRAWFYVLTPARASVCTVCASFWVAAPAPFLPILPELEGINRVLIWLGPVGVSVVLAHFTEPEDPPVLPALDDIGPHPGDELTEASTQTADEDS